jgi:hypothetical protein
VRLEGLGKLKNPPYPGLEPATFRPTGLLLEEEGLGTSAETVD